MPGESKLLPPEELAVRVGGVLRERGQTVGVIESSAGGLVSAALLAVPGASAFFLGGAVVYTRLARRNLLGLSDEDVAGIRGETEPYVNLTANRIRELLGATWGLSESGFAGPTGGPRGGAPGHVCIGIAGLVTTTKTMQTGAADRAFNMDRFARLLLTLFQDVLDAEVPASRV